MMIKGSLSVVYKFRLIWRIVPIKRCFKYGTLLPFLLLLVSVLNENPQESISGISPQDEVTAKEYQNLRVIHVNKSVLVKVMPARQEDKHLCLDSRPTVTVEGKGLHCGSEGEE